MERTPVGSTNLKSVGYDRESEILEIEFQDSSIYQHKKVPEEVYKELMETISKGKYYRQEIKSKYGIERIKPGLRKPSRRKRGPRSPRKPRRRT